MSNRWIAFSAASFVALMLSVAFASGKLYETFCQITGFGGTTRIAEERPSEVLDREVTIRFDSNVNGLPLQFRSRDTSHVIRLGEMGLAFYEVTNTSNQDVMAIASYNVTPHKTGSYFRKLECFCFEDRLFKAGETAQLPVVFFVAPELDGENHLDDVSAITLSYTFFPSRKELEQKTASVDPALVSR